MPKEEWGTKRLCPQCGSRFYDLQKDPMTCPVCDAEMTLESLSQGRTRSLVSEKTASKDDDQSDDLIEDDLDDDDDSSVDDDLLEDDDDDGDVSLDDIADVSNEDDD
ncbi:TIGR02300 family protein [Paracoccus sediminicola]|uniref:TIGR02300 family protein n=1 Tax=Paracoccus sediminicola TaxID=3017783 RepID=UPI0022F0E00D|nr:TIGR02300 family protein [Paracoccus sediminicola]WBU57429.1 TIGR02300 family protein [Paracoccus sediminicola]